jgi:hypothetical protein
LDQNIWKWKFAVQLWFAIFGIIFLFVASSKLLNCTGIDVWYNCCFFLQLLLFCLLKC